MKSRDETLRELIAKMRSENEALRREAWKWNQPVREASAVLVRTMRRTGGDR